MLLQGQLFPVTPLTRINPTMKVTKSLILPVVLSFTVATAALQGAISITSSSYSYSQDFDSLPTADSGSFTWADDSTLPGWYRRANVNNSTQTLDPDLVDLSAKGDNVGVPAFYNASTAGSSDRAVGFRINGLPGGLKKGSVGVVFQNNTGLTITGFDLGYTGENWWQAVNDTTLIFQYAIVDSFATDISGDIDRAQADTWTDVGGLSWTVTGVEGSNNWVNGKTNSSVFNPFTISGLSIAPGQELVIRWRIAESGVQRSGLFIDDVTFGNLVTVPEPSTYALLAGLATLGLVMVRRRRSGRQ